jgi:hypothetical protein
MLLPSRGYTGEGTSPRRFRGIVQGTVPAANVGGKIRPFAASPLPPRPTAIRLPCSLGVPVQPAERHPMNLISEAASRPNRRGR